VIAEWRMIRSVCAGLTPVSAHAQSVSHQQHRAADVGKNMFIRHNPDFTATSEAKKRRVINRLGKSIT